MEILSEDSISELVDQSRTDRVPAWTAPPPRREPRVKTIDFSQPTKFTKEEQRHLRRAHEAFCRTASTRLSADFRMPIDLELITATQYTWSSALSELQPEAVCAVCEAQPTGARLAMAADLPLLLSLIERLFGGEAGKVPADRELSDIDLTVTRRVFKMLLDQLSVAWTDLLGLSLELVDFESEPASAHIVPLSDPVIALTAEARFARNSFTIATILPYSCVESAPRQLPTSARHGGDPKGVMARRMHNAVGESKVELRAEVGASELSLDEVLALKVGDKVTLGPASQSDVILYAESVPVHRTRAGRNGAHRAVQIVEPAGGER